MAVRIPSPASTVRRAYNETGIDTSSCRIKVESRGMLPSVNKPKYYNTTRSLQKTYNETRIDTSSCRINVESCGLLPSVNKPKYYYITHSLQKNVQ